MAANFSIPHCVAHTLRHGPPRVRDFASVDPLTQADSRLVSVTLDGSLPEFGAVLCVAGRELARVRYPRGGPQRPVTAAELDAKVADLAGDRLTATLEEPGATAAHVSPRGGFLTLPGCALLPCRVMSPAYHTSSPTLNELTSGPMASTTPSASYPSTVGRAAYQVV